MKAIRFRVKPYSGNSVSLTLILTALVLGLSAVQPAHAASWITNSPMNFARSGHTATLLGNGKVLVTGSSGTSSELYDPATGTWTMTGSMNNMTHTGSTATWLPNGKVLLVGGNDNSAELYDPMTGTWSLTGSMNAARTDHTATLLANGRVLVAGGFDPNLYIYLNSAEIYDPATETWTTTGSLLDSRMYHTATLLTNGNVLVAGGLLVPSGVAELYDPVSGTWSVTSPMKTARYWHTATLLPNGKVLVAGGLGYGNGAATNGAELFNPSTKTWSLTGAMNTARENHTATLLPNGQVLIAGGSGGVAGITNAVEIFYPSNGTWTVTNSLNVARQYHTATMLPNGKVLAAGGNGRSGTTNSVEVYDLTVNPPTGTNASIGNMPSPVYWHVATLLTNGVVLLTYGYYSQAVPSLYTQLYNPLNGLWTTLIVGQTIVHPTITLLSDGRVLVAGGYSTPMSGPAWALTNAAVYDSSSQTWIATGSMNTGRVWHSATLLPNGKVLAAGGYTGIRTNAMMLASVELYDPASGTWTLTGSMNAAGANHTATLLPNGKVLVAGSTNFSELYDPVTGRWTVTGTMVTSRTWHTATLLNNGKVLAVGGLYGTNGPANANVTNILSSAELYDPSNGAWATTGSMTTNRWCQTATLLPNGKVLVTGGTTSNSQKDFLSSAELYDPIVGTWTNTGAMTSARAFHTATLLLNEKVFIAGGGNIMGNPMTAELYDIGLDYTNSWRPQIATVSWPLNLGGSLVITGAQFRGIAEGSSGNTQDSSADYPLVQFHRLDNDQTIFLPATNWSTNSFASVPVWNFPAGPALATVFVNGIQSTSAIVNVSVPIPTAPILSAPQTLANGAFQFGFTNSVGALFGVLATTNLSLPLTSWTTLGGAVETSPGQFQFTDPQATNGGLRFYRTFAP